MTWVYSSFVPLSFGFFCGKSEWVDEILVSNVSNKHGERFDQDISVMERRWNPGMSADYCWDIKKEDHTPHKRLRGTKVV